MSIISTESLHNRQIILLQSISSLQYEERIFRGVYFLALPFFDKGFRIILRRIKGERYKRQQCDDFIQYYLQTYCLILIS